MSFINIERTGTSKSGLTDIYTVFSRGIPLGEIRWYSHWRKYTFSPNPGTVFDNTCLIEIAAHCEAIQKNRES